MSNNIGPDLLSPQLWSARVQYLLKNTLVGAAISNTEERSTLQYGYRVHRPYTGDVYAQDYTKGVAPTFQDMTAVDEYLTVDQAKIIPLYMDDIDVKQNKYDTLTKYSDRMSYQMRNQLDQAVLANVSSSLLGNVVEGGSAFTLSTSNIFKYFSEAKADLFNNGVEDTKPWYTVIDADTASLIEQTFAFNGFKVSDDALVNGYGAKAYVGDWQGLQVFKSQNLPVSKTWTYTADPSEGTTLKIKGVTFTFKNAIGTTPGAVDTTGVVDTTIGTNLVAAINGTTPGTAYYPLSVNDRQKLKAQGVTASYEASTNILTVTAFGKMSAGGTQDNVTSTSEIMVCPIGQLGAIDMVLQKDVEIEILRVTDGRKGQNITAFDLFGTFMFREGAQRTYALAITK